MQKLLDLFLVIELIFLLVFILLIDIAYICLHIISRQMTVSGSVSFITLQMIILLLCCVHIIITFRLLNRFTIYPDLMVSSNINPHWSNSGSAHNSRSARSGPGTSSHDMQLSRNNHNLSGIRSASVPAIAQQHGHHNGVVSNNNAQGSIFTSEVDVSSILLPSISHDNLDSQENVNRNSVLY